MKKRLALVLLIACCGAAQARDFTSSITEGEGIEKLRPEFRTPDEPNQLFYVQRSPNSNTVVYAARLDARGDFESTPVEAFWRKFNIDGSKQPLNFMERLMAYGVRMNPQHKGQPVTFTKIGRAHV